MLADTENDTCQKALPEAVVVVATYNERENLESLVRQILTLQLRIHLLIVDDSSPDGTGEVAHELARQEPRIHVLVREKKEGLAAALIAGFRLALDQNYELVLNLDGDLSHDPLAIPTLLAAGESADLVIGSRFVNGVRAVNWAAGRLLMSLAAARYVGLMTGMSFQDPTSGFRCFRRGALKAAVTEPMLSRGYSFHIECLHRIWRAGGKVVEVPIVYTERSLGESKRSIGIVGEALWITFMLLMQKRASRCSPRSRAIKD